MEAYHFDLSSVDDCCIASFGGEIGTQCYSDFRNDYNEICRLLAGSETKHLVVDLTDATFFGSLFVGIMIKLSLATRKQGGKFALCGLSDQLNELMKKLLLLERDSDSTNGMQHFTTLADALSEIRSQGD